MYAINASKLGIVCIGLWVRGDGETSFPGWNIINFTIHVSDRVFAALDRIGMQAKDRSHLVISSSLLFPLPRLPYLVPFPAFISLPHVHFASHLLPLLSPS